MSIVENFDADSFNTLLTIPPFLIQLLMPPSRYPITLSKPTLDSLIIASSSLPSGATIISFLETSSNISPTQGANLPSNPIKIDPGMWDDEKSSALLTSSIVIFSLSLLATYLAVNTLRLLLIISSDSS